MPAELGRIGLVIGSWAERMLGDAHFPGLVGGIATGPAL